jgi:ornithine cyclodeaminase/alanine dehydrogenase-like protein (mu-crystallin family)
MTLLVDEHDVREIMRAPGATLDLVDRLESALAAPVAQAPRVVVDYPPGSVGEHRGRSLRLLPSFAPSLGGALRLYTTLKDGDPRRPAPCELLLFFDRETMEARTVVEGYSLHAQRTGAPSAVAVRHLTRPGPLAVGVVGTGRQARGQLAAAASVRPLASIRAYGRSADSLSAFCREMTGLLGVEVEPCAGAEAAVRDAELVLLATSAGRPVVERSWLRDDALVVSIAPCELDEATVLDALLVPCSRADVLHGTPRWTPVPELVEAGRLDPALGPELVEIVERPPATGGLTVFLSTGTALWDLVAAAWVDDRARALDLGRVLWDGARSAGGFMTPVPTPTEEPS